jgi:hypothetical protein
MMKGKSGNTKYTGKPTLAKGSSVKAGMPKATTKLGGGKQIGKR